MTQKGAFFEWPPRWFAGYEKTAPIFNHQTSPLNKKHLMIEWEAVAKGGGGRKGDNFIDGFYKLEIEILAGQQLVNPTIIYSGQTLALETRPNS